MFNSNGVLAQQPDQPAKFPSGRRAKKNDSKLNGKSRKGKEEVWKLYLRALGSTSDKLEVSAKNPGKNNHNEEIKREPTLTTSNHVKAKRDIGGTELEAVSVQTSSKDANNGGILKQSNSPATLAPSSRGIGAPKSNESRVSREISDDNQHQQKCESSDESENCNDTRKQILKRMADCVVRRQAKHKGDNVLVRYSYKDEGFGEILGYRPSLNVIVEEEEQEGEREGQEEGGDHVISTIILNCQESREQRISILRQEISELWNRLQRIESDFNLARKKILDLPLKDKF